MAFDANAGTPNSITKWDRCVERMQGGEHPSRFGFQGSWSDVYRFGNRFRFAKSLTGVSLDTYTEETENGYTGLLQTFTSWSAFECYLRLVGIKQEDCQAFIDPFKPKEFIQRVRNIEQNGDFYRFLKPLVRRKPRDQLEKFLGNRDFNATYLASTIRHVFAHGTLAANPGGVRAQNIVLITREVNGFLFEIMETDFSARI